MSCIRHKEPYLPLGIDQWRRGPRIWRNAEKSFITWPSQPPGVLVGASVYRTSMMPWFKQSWFRKMITTELSNMPWLVLFHGIVNIDCFILQIWCSTGSLQGPSELILQLGAQRSLQILGCERLASKVVLPRHIFVFGKFQRSMKKEHLKRLWMYFALILHHFFLSISFKADSL